MIENPAIALTVLMLALVAGVELISRVPTLLHTPLMSGSNAISGISVVGAITAAGSEAQGLAALLGFIAVVMATINVVAGFLVTEQMLAMFKERESR